MAFFQKFCLGPKLFSFSSKATGRGMMGVGWWDTRNMRDVLCGKDKNKPKEARQLLAPLKVGKNEYPNQGGFNCFVLVFLNHKR